MVGAGASCAGPGIIGPVNSNTVLTPGNPPLGAYVMPALQARFPDCWNDSVRPYFTKSPGDFEAGMASMFEAMWLRGSNGSRTHFNYCIYRMAEYFNNWHLSDVNENLYVRFVKQLIDWGTLSVTGSNPETSFVSLNYERLLEWSIMHCGIFTTFRSRGHEKHQNNVPVWKPHGSVHFLASVRGEVHGYPNIDDLSGDLKALTREQMPHYLEIIAQQLDQGNHDPIPIVMSLYMLGKPTMVGQQVIASIRKSYTQEVASADILVLIGVRPVWTDNHLFDPIRSRTGDTLFIGGAGKEFESLKDACSGRVFHLASTFQQAVEQRVLQPWLTAS